MIMASQMSGAELYQATCLRLPLELKSRAQEAGINLSQTLREALEEKLKGNGGVEHGG